jgi:sigma-B regulation protein RsbU (phosphoserine phosphatase)
MAAPAIVPGPALSDRLVLDGIGLFVSMILGYVLFIIFISGQGIRHIRLRTEIDLAREIQTVLVPPIALTQAGIDIYGASLPASEVGGDMLDVATLHETITCCVADIAGHGVGANLLMGMFKSSLRTRIRQRGDLATLMTDVNEALYPLRKPSMFLTVAAVQFNGGPDVHFLVAGHLPILHYRATEGAVVKLTTRQIALGMQPGYRFAQGSARVAEGDCLVIATDGMTEVENRNREPFGIERLASLVRDQHSRSPRELYAAIRTAVERHGRQRDDQTLMVIRRQEAEPSPRSESR